jgi:hypothetical protein
LFVNGEKAGQVAFGGTGGWDKWKTVDAKVALKKGGNFIKVVAVGAGPNLDALAVNK